MSVKKNLAVDLGFTFNFNADYVDPDGQPIDLTGHTVTFEVRRKTGELVLDKAAVAGIGTIAATITDEETALFPSAPLVYQLIHEEPGGDKYRLAWGDFKVVTGL